MEEYKTTDIQDMIEGIAEHHRCSIKVGKIVSIFDPNIPEYLEKLFFVIDVQQVGPETVVTVMGQDLECDFTIKIAKIENIILKELFTIDDVFPPRRILPGQLI